MYKIKKFITSGALHSLAHALVINRLDFLNSLYEGLPAGVIARLQRCQNATARLITGVHRREPITPTLKDLHWLPVRWRIHYKILVIIYKVITQGQPIYLGDKLEQYVPGRDLRSAADTLLLEKTYHKKRYGLRRFSVHGPWLWNKLPRGVRDSRTLVSFKKRLKTHLFTQAFKSKMLVH